MQFIECRNSTVEYGELAAALVARADELGIHPREILALPTGFSVPDVLAGEFVAPKTPPMWWSEPLEPADVVFESDGTVTLTPEAQEAVEAAAAVPLDPATDLAPRPAPSRRQGNTSAPRRGQSRV